MNKLEEKILAIFAKKQTAGLATIAADGKPWVRYVTLFAGSRFPLLFCTAAGSRKIAHIRANPEVHITCGNLTPPDDSVFLQVQGRAVVSDDADLRKIHWNDEYLRYFKGADDPDYVIVRVQPYRIEYNGPGSFIPEVWERTISSPGS